MSASHTRTSAMVRSLGIGVSVPEPRVRLGRGWPERGGRGSEARGVEQREVHRRLAVNDPVGDVAAGRRRVLEAVTAEADGQEEAGDPRGPADDRVIVWRERTQTGPAARNLRRLEHGNTLDRR